MTAFGQGLAMIVFDLTADLPNLNTPNQHRMEVRFAAVLPHAITCFVHTKLHQNRHRQKNLTWLRGLKMDTFQINYILNKRLRSIYKVVYARDQLPLLKTCAPTCYLINTKPGSSSDKHRLAVYVRCNPSTLYFDSFGFPSEHPMILKNIPLNGSALQKCFKSCSWLCVENIVLCFYYIFID